MTDRLNGVYVAFETDVREDDAAPLVAAIRQLRGVLAVEPNVTTMSDWIAEERARRELGERLVAILYPKTSTANAKEPR